MADTAIDTNAQGAERTPTAQPVTQSTAVSVDMAQIERIAQEQADRKAQAVVRDMLKQQGLDNDAIKTMLTDWQSKQTTPEQEMEKLKGELAAVTAEKDKLTREQLLRSHGLTDDEDIKVYDIRIGQLVTEGKTFEQTAKEYFEKHPLSQGAGVVSGVAGGTPISTPTVDDVRKMSHTELTALKEKNPSVFDQMKKALGL